MVGCLPGHLCHLETDSSDLGCSVIRFLLLGLYLHSCYGIFSVQLCRIQRSPSDASLSCHHHYSYHQLTEKEKRKSAAAVFGCCLFQRKSINENIGNARCVPYISFICQISIVSEVFNRFIVEIDDNLRNNLWHLTRRYIDPFHIILAVSDLIGIGIE